MLRWGRSPRRSSDERWPQERMEMRFCTAISCMDGRIQLPVIRYLQTRFHAKYVDLITEPGPSLILARQTDSGLVKSILARVHISVSNHHSVGIAVVGHHDCAGNPATKDEQVLHIRESVKFARQQYEKSEVIGLWVDENWEVFEIAESG